MSDRQLPQNTAAERGLLGIIIDRNDALFEVSSIVHGADFFEPTNGEIYTLLRDMIETGRSATPTTLMHDLSQDRDIGGITAAEYLATMEREAPPPAMARTLARTIQDLAFKRKLIGVAAAHMDELYSAPATISAMEIEARFSATLGDAIKGAADVGPQPLWAVARDVLKETQAALQSGVSRGLPSGLKAWDDLCGGFMPGQTTVLGGASGSGKTSLAKQIARNIAARYPVMFMSLEQSRKEIATSELAADTGIASSAIDEARLNPDEFDRLIDAQKAMKSSHLVMDGGGQSIAAIRGKAIKMQREQGLAFLAIDHLQYVVVPGRELFQEQREVLKAVNAIAGDLDIPVLLLAQFVASYARDAVGAKTIRDPHYSDLFNGAAVEQEADVLMLVHREEWILARREPPIGQPQERSEWQSAMEKARGRAKFILNKRRGRQGYGNRIVGFDGRSQRFTDELPVSRFGAPLLAVTDDGGKILM